MKSFKDTLSNVFNGKTQAGMHAVFAGLVLGVEVISLMSGASAALATAPAALLVVGAAALVGGLATVFNKQAAAQPALARVRADNGYADRSREGGLAVFSNGRLQARKGTYSR